MPTLQCGDRSVDCGRGELLRDEFIDERTDWDLGSSREASDKYGVSALAFGYPRNSRPSDAGRESVVASDDGERDGRGSGDGPQRWNPQPVGE
jgi:hypothetical protein